MADALNRILNDSQQAAQHYARLVHESNVDAKLWDFVEMGKDHEQIVGQLKNTFNQIGAQPRRTVGEGSGLSKHQALRLYEDPATLRALRDAERDELEDCKNLLEREDNRLVTTLVANRIMPVLSAHINTLERYLERAESIQRH